MPKPRGGVYKATQRDTRYAGIIEACSPPNHPWNTPHQTPPLHDVDQALDVQRGVYRSARHAGISAHHVAITCPTCGAGFHIAHQESKVEGSHKRGCKTPLYVVSFQLASKSIGRAAIAQHVNGGGKLAYNLRRNRDQ